MILIHMDYIGIEMVYESKYSVKELTREFLLKTCDRYFVNGNQPYIWLDSAASGGKIYCESREIGEIITTPSGRSSWEVVSAETLVNNPEVNIDMIEKKFLSFIQDHPDVEQIELEYI